MFTSSRLPPSIRKYVYVGKSIVTRHIHTTIRCCVEFGDSVCSCQQYRRDYGSCKSHVFTTSGVENTPLGGVRVLDITRVLAGPYCTMILGDLGAEVIKIERPGHGDDTRTWGPPWVNKESAYFLSVNRNKKGMTVDMKKPEGAEIVRKLACRSDVLVENYIPGKLSEMGLGYSQLKEVAPRLIYCSITGYGQTGPYSQRAGYDVVAAGYGGLLHITGPVDGEPCRVGVAMTDLSTGLYAHGAILAALLYRQRTGKGQHIDCNLLATQIATDCHIASNYLNAGKEAKRHGTGHESIVPYQAFKTKDGYIIVGAGNNGLFADVCQRMGLSQLIEDPLYADNALRVKNRKLLIETMSVSFSGKSTKDWLAVFEGSTFPYGPINNMEQTFNDPQVIHNGLIQAMDHPEAGRIRIPGPAVKYSESDTVLQNASPTLGQHTDEILQSELGMRPQQIQALRSSGVII